MQDGGEEGDVEMWVVLLTAWATGQNRLGDEQLPLVVAKAR